MGAGLALTPETEGLAAQAETRARAVNASPDLVRIGRFLLRSEAIASSRIEGIAPSAHKIALAELGQQEEIKGLSEQARSVAHNMTLVRRAVEELSDSHPMTREHLVALHRSLLPDSPEHHGIRVVQNRSGGSSYHPLDADFVPPPADSLNGAIQGREAERQCCTEHAWDRTRCMDRVLPQSRHDRLRSGGADFR